MSNMGDRAAGTAKSYMGGAKQTVGETLGDNSMAASGAEQKAHGEAQRAGAEA
ncbi:hypothetical protein BX616_008210, partial [Lobosporangium transversale]